VYADIGLFGNSWFGKSNRHHLNIVLAKLLCVLMSVKSRELELIIGGGDIAYCGPNNICQRAASLDFANGIAKGHDGLYYVVSSTTGRVIVYQLEKNGTLTKTDEIALGMVLDNVSVDANDGFYVAGFPSVAKLMKAANNPLPVDPPSTVWQIKKRADGSGYEAAKFLEDARAEVLPGSSTAVHDVKTGRVFLSGMTSPFITVCEKRVD